MSEVLTTKSPISRRPPVLRSGEAAQRTTPADSGERFAGKSTDTGQFVYFGWILGTENIIAVAFDSSAVDTAGARRVKAYVCDRHGNPDGLAVWFYGSSAEGTSTTLTSTNGNHTLLLDHARSEVVTGAFAGVGGATRRFAAMRASAGAGIYDVTLEMRLHARGAATNSALLDAREIGDGGVTGSLLATDGETLEFTIRVRAKVTEAELAQGGMSARFRGQRSAHIGPDSYTAVVSGAGMFWLGRG